MTPSWLHQVRPGDKFMYRDVELVAVAIPHGLNCFYCWRNKFRGNARVTCMTLPACTGIAFMTPEDAVFHKLTGANPNEKPG